MSSDFASVILAFGEPPRSSEQGYECFARDLQSDGSYGEYLVRAKSSHRDARQLSCYSGLSYLYRFVERDDPDSEWKFRQIGVYCSYSQATDSYLYIFLQPHPGSKFDSRLDTCRSRADSTKTLLADPFRIRELLITTYSDNWRWYLREIASDFQHDVSAF